MVSACDKMLVGLLRALVEADRARQRRKARPVYALFLPPSVGREVYLDEDERRRFERFRGTDLGPGMRRNCSRF